MSAWASVGFVSEVLHSLIIGGLLGRILGYLGGASKRTRRMVTAASLQMAQFGGESPVPDNTP